MPCSSAHSLLNYRHHSPSFPLIKVIAKLTPSKEDVASVIELTAAKVVEAIQAQSMNFYLIEGREISFKHVYPSSTLWALSYPSRRPAP